MSGDGLDEDAAGGPPDGTEEFDQVDDGFDDEFDDEFDEDWAGADPDADASGPSAISPMFLVLGAVAVIVLVAVLVATSGSGSEDAGPTGTTTTAAAGSDSSTTVAKGPTWPDIVQGRPAIFGQLHDPISVVDPEAAPGVYVWQDYDGWHAWVVDPTGKAAAKGTLTSNEPFKDAVTAAPDQGSVVLDGKNLSFDVSGVDAKAAGINFNLGFYAGDVTINLNGTDLPLLLGAEARPSPLPTVITKAVQPN